MAESAERKRKRRKRWGDAPPSAETETAPASSTINNGAPPDDSKAKALALQESIRQRLAALKSKQAVPSVSNKRPAETEVQQQQQPPVKKAKHFELDMSVTGPTFQEKPTKKVNPYLDLADNDETNEEAVEDERLVRASKPRQRHKALSFVEPGTFVEIAERKRQKAANALAAGFSSGRKTGMYVTASDMANVYGSSTVEETDSATVVRPDADPDDRDPIVEWWDVDLLPSKLKKQVTAQEGKALTKRTKAQLQQLSTNEASMPEEEEQDDEKLRITCFEQASLSYSKTATLVQHIVPIRTNAKPPPQPVLHLTKKERKRQRKLRRAEKQRELQDMQAAGLIPPPEPRLTLKNFIQVMGDQAFVDPSQMERKVAEQMQARQQAHLQRNEANRLTKQQRAEKLARKLQEDTTGSVSVALFWVKDMSHPYHRAKVELNARQNNITGGVLECEHPSIACVICEGGPKAIKRYIRLMTVRMKWTGTDDVVEEDEEDEEEKTHKFNPENKCELVWTGMGTRRLFKSFVFQSCESSDVARKVLKAKGVGHFWDQVLIHASGRGESFNLKLASEDGDVTMEEAR